jgi:carbamate kinase
MTVRIVAALGGNALLRRGEPLDPAAQERNVEVAADALAGLANEHELVVTHGNGPQVGLLALQQGNHYPFPLDVLGAETEGMIGYLIEQALGNRLPDRWVTALLTRTEVDPADPAFLNPSKPIGPLYHRDKALEMAERRGWVIAPDGDRWRRVVPSPRPRRIVEIDAIELLVQAGAVVVCAGGGGIPVVRSAGGELHGVEAVVDKDLAAAHLAIGLRADALLMLTDVDGLYDGWPDPSASLVREATPDELSQLALAPGSMGPKVEAAATFVSATGGIAAIGALGDAGSLLAGDAGTLVRSRAPLEAIR